MHWILILWYITKVGSAVPVTVESLTEKGCKQQALEIIEAKGLPVIAICVEKR